MAFKKLQGFIDNISKTNKNATYRAINKALSKTKTKFRRDISKDTGLKSKQLSKRFFQKKASAKSLSALIGIGTKFEVSLAEFSPRIKTVKKGKRKYQGVTVKIGGERTLVEKGFLYTKKKSLIFARTSEKRLPIKVQRYSLLKTAQSHQAKTKEFFRQEFLNYYKTQLKYEIKKQTT